VTFPSRRSSALARPNSCGGNAGRTGATAGGGDGSAVAWALDVPSAWRRTPAADDEGTCFSTGAPAAAALVVADAGGVGASELGSGRATVAVSAGAGSGAPDAEGDGTGTDAGGGRIQPAVQTAPAPISRARSPAPASADGCQRRGACASAIGCETMVAAVVLRRSSAGSSSPDHAARSA